MSSNANFYMPVKLHAGANTAELDAPFVESLPISGRFDPVAVLTPRPGSQLTPGMYVFTDDNRWHLALTQLDVSKALTDDLDASVYFDVPSAVTVPTGGLVFRNSVPAQITSLVPANVIYVVLVPKTLDGAGVASVNGKTGAVTLTASDVGAATAAQGAKADTALQAVPVATASVLGGVKQGTGVTIAADGTLTATGSGGTVTSVNVAVPSILSSSGGPVTGSGTITLGLSNQAAAVVFAGPATGAAAEPTFRALAATDIPDLDAAKITTGTLAAARVGTGTPSATTVLKNGAWATLVAADIPNLSTDKLTSGTLPVARGGTGAATLTGYVKGTGTGAMTAAAKVPWADLDNVPTTFAPVTATDTVVGGVSIPANGGLAVTGAGALSVTKAANVAALANPNGATTGEVATAVNDIIAALVAANLMVAP